MSDVPLPYRTFTMRLVPFVAQRKIRVEFWEEDGGGRGVADARSYPITSWRGHELASVVAADVQGMFEACIDWIVWMDSERP